MVSKEKQFFEGFYMYGEITASERTIMKIYVLLGYFLSGGKVGC